MYSFMKYASRGNRFSDQLRDIAVELAIEQMEQDPVNASFWEPYMEDVIYRLKDYETRRPILVSANIEAPELRQVFREVPGYTLEGAISMELPVYIHIPFTSIRQVHPEPPLFTRENFIKRLAQKFPDKLVTDYAPETISGEVEIPRLSAYSDAESYKMNDMLLPSGCSALLSTQFADISHVSYVAKDPFKNKYSPPDSVVVKVSSIPDFLKKKIEECMSWETTSSASSFLKTKTVKYAYNYLEDLVEEFLEPPYDANSLDEVVANLSKKYKLTAGQLVTARNIAKQKLSVYSKATRR